MKNHLPNSAAQSKGSRELGEGSRKGRKGSELSIDTH